MFGLAILIIRKGAGLGVKALYFVVFILFISLVMFFLGGTESVANTDVSLANIKLKNPQNFFIVFAIIFPAFTGMTAGVGLSGDLKKPAKSIPLGTLIATILGMVIYFFIVYKLAKSVSTEELLEQQLIMGRIAIGGAIIIPMGLAASTFSSALGSVMVAPRTLQALAMDYAFPSKRINRWLGASNAKNNEPQNASLVTVIIAFLFVALGDVNEVATIISMFFMVTYGSLCLISFLNHFGSSPSYRPSFRSRWYISLAGFLVSVWVMFKINTPYALISFVLISLIYLYINNYHKNQKGFAAIFANSLFQLNRNLQVLIQKKSSKHSHNEWRPSVICISKDSFKRDKAFQLLNWISYKYGFGTYLHHIVGYYCRANAQLAKKELSKLVNEVNEIENHVFIDTIISPSNTSAIAQAIQLPGIAGMENNMIVFEFDKDNPNNLEDILDNFALVNSGEFDICILGSSNKTIRFKNGIHVWINSLDTENSNLMILLSFIILGHPDWKKAHIQIFDISRPEEVEMNKLKMKEVVKAGRLPITEKNVKIIVKEPHDTNKSIINSYSENAGLILIGIREEIVKHKKEQVFEGYEQLGTTLFVHSKDEKKIE
jgi:amino acid transporter